MIFYNEILKCPVNQDEKMIKLNGLCDKLYITGSEKIFFSYNIDMFDVILCIFVVLL